MLSTLSAASLRAYFPSVVQICLSVCHKVKIKWQFLPKPKEEGKYHKYKSSFLFHLDWSQGEQSPLFCNPLLWYHTLRSTWILQYLSFRTQANSKCSGDWHQLIVLLWQSHCPLMQASLHLRKIHIFHIVMYSVKSRIHTRLWFSLLL